MSHGSPLAPLPNSEDAYAPSSWKDYLDYLHDSTDTQSPPAVCGYGSSGSQTKSGGYWGGVYSPTQNRVCYAPYIAGSTGVWCYVDTTDGVPVAYSAGTSGLVGGYPYIGGVWSPKQDKVFFTPGTQHSLFHYMDCKTGLIGVYGATGIVHSASYYGGAYDPVSDKVWLPPAIGVTGKGWPAIDCTQRKVNWYSAGVSGVLVDPLFVQASYHGAVYSPNQRRVYYIPRWQTHSNVWHYVDCGSDTVVPYKSDIVGTGASGLMYAGGVYDPIGDRIYMVPRLYNGSDTWHYIDCKYGSVVGYKPGVSGLSAGVLFAEGVYSPLSRRVYLSPGSSSESTGSWYYLDTMSNRLCRYGSGTPSTTATNAYYSGVYAPGVNRVYMSPGGQADRNTWHYIQETCSAPVPLDLGYSVAHLASPQVSFLCIDEAEVSMLCVDGSDGKGGVFQLTTVFQDGVQRNAYCSWASSDPSVATVDSSGLVTAVSNGGAALGKDVTITASYGGLSYSCLFTVYQTMPSAEVEGAGLWLCKGGCGGKNSTGSIFSITANFATTAIPPGEFCSARLVSKYCVASDGSYAQHLKNGVASRYINQSLALHTRGAMVAVMSGTTETQYISSSGQSVGSVYTKDIWVSPSTYQENNQPYALTEVSTNSRSVGYHNLMWGDVTHKIIFSALSKTPTKPGLTADICYIPQNYVRCSDRATPAGVLRSSYTVILNIGTLGADYDLEANNVPASWFNV